jgi:signal peptidase II
MGASAVTGRPFLLFWLTAAAGFVLDQLAKAAAVRFLPAHQSRALLGDWVRLTLTHNPGSAFGLISSGGALIAVGAAVCLAVLAYAFLGQGLRRDRGQAIALGLVFGGSAGNLTDRVATGGVVDFIDLRVWPVFNLADIAITAGFVLLALRLVKRR